MNNDLNNTVERLSQQLTEAIEDDPLGALSVISTLQSDTNRHLREAVRRASMSSSWSEIAGAMGVSRQAAHQRFRAYAKDVTAEMSQQHRKMRQASRTGDSVSAAQARARRDQLAGQLRATANALKKRS